MTRAEHVRWCKERALEILRTGDYQEAIMSMLSDLGRHDETSNMVGTIGMLGLFELQKPGGPTAQSARRFIEGFAE